MKLPKVIYFLSAVFLLTGCASGYKAINPQTLNYESGSEDKSVTLQYKYNVLKNRYAKKEANNHLKLISIKITNNSDKDLVFGKDIKLAYSNNSILNIVNTDEVYSEVKQSSATYLLYLLLTPAKFTTSENGLQTSSAPIGYVLGPGLALGNMFAASAANTNFKTELLHYNIIGTTVKKGKTLYGLIGIRSDDYEALKIKVE